jgi:MoaA/NifB/PqqE/SkfB family radical SAM enzyme
MNITVGHYNVFSEDLEKLCQYSNKKGYRTFVNIAIPSGNWKGNLDVVIDEKDREHLIKLRKKYGNMYRDIWNPFDRDNEKCLGCQTMSKLYITPAGDVLPCSFLHIKIGNIYEQSLKDIIKYGYRIKYFREHSALCLAGEDLEFIKAYMQNDMTAIKPIEASKVFQLKDFIE